MWFLVWTNVHVHCCGKVVYFGFVICVFKTPGRSPAQQNVRAQHSYPIQQENCFRIYSVIMSGCTVFHRGPTASTLQWAESPGKCASQKVIKSHQSSRDRGHATKDHDSAYHLTRPMHKARRIAVGGVVGDFNGLSPLGSAHVKRSLNHINPAQPGDIHAGRGRGTDAAP